MTKLTENLKRMLNALAYAHAGENLPLSEKGRYLNKSIAADLGASSQAAVPIPAQKQVALYMGSEMPEAMMDYAVQTCVRLQHGLTVLTFQTEGRARELLERYAATLASSGISMQLVSLAGDPLVGLARYLRRHPAVAFLVCNETGFLGRGFLNGTQRQDLLPVPVVLVSPHRESAQRDLPGEKAGTQRVA